MADSIKIPEMQRTNIEFDRQHHLANWLIKSGPHMLTHMKSATADIENEEKFVINKGSSPSATSKASKYNSSNNANTMFFLMSKNCTSNALLQSQSGKHFNGASASPRNGTPAFGQLGPIEGRKPKLRRFNSHDTSSNIFSVADFENARLARRNEIEMMKRLQRRVHLNSNECGAIGGTTNGIGDLSGDYSTNDSKASKYSNDSQQEPLLAAEFLDRYALPRVVRISYKTKSSYETLQSSSSNDSTSALKGSECQFHPEGVYNTSGFIYDKSGSAEGTGTSSSTGSSNANMTNHGYSGNDHKNFVSDHSNTNFKITSSDNQQGDLYLLYRYIRKRNIFHGHNAKMALINRRKGFSIPQEFSGYFSLLNDKGLPTATLYTSLIQLVRERVYKFVSVDNMPAFTESLSNTTNLVGEGCLTLYTTPTAANNRPQYVKTRALGGQVFRLLAVFEDGKQDQHTISSVSSVFANKSNSNHGRQKEKGRYAQILNENRQILYVSLSTKGKFYEIEPGIPQILQKVGRINNDQNKRLNPDCVHRISELIPQNKTLPVTLRYISGPSGCTNVIPENICITHITTENVVIACPIEDVEVQSPLHLRKLYLSKEMKLMKSTLGFESEQRMLANPNVQNILKFCQFNCDQFLKMVELDMTVRPDRNGSKNRGDALKMLNPLHLPRLLRREKTTISAHEKEDSIIFLTKSDLANLEEKDSSVNMTSDNFSRTSRITDKMKVFQTTKKKWFRKHDKTSPTRDDTNNIDVMELDLQVNRMSMERYSDMSKLLQERFGGDNVNFKKQTANSEPSGASDNSCSDTDTTTLVTIEEKLKNNQSFDKVHKTELQKSFSLQDIELSSSERKPDLLTTHNTTDTISETGTDDDDLDNHNFVQQSFITEKLYNEFHVKTKQYSKSSSSLHQLLNFSLPQKLQIHDNKRSVKQDKYSGKLNRKRGVGLVPETLAATSKNADQTKTIRSTLITNTVIEDDLPYSSVRDSLILSSDESTPENDAGNICQALNLIDYTQENIYAEICNDNSMLSNIPISHTHMTFLDQTHSTDVSDDFGDYASLNYPSNYLSFHYQEQPSVADNEKSITTNSGGSCTAVSRVQINYSPKPALRQSGFADDGSSGEQKIEAQRMYKDTHSNITTVELQCSNGFGLNPTVILSEDVASDCTSHRNTNSSVTTSPNFKE